MPKGRPGKVKWTAEQEDMIRQLYQEMGPKKLAEKMGVPESSLQSRARTLGVRTSKSFQWTNGMLEMLQNRYAIDGPQKLSKEMDIPYWVLLSKAKRMGIEATRKTPPKNFQWTDEMVNAIKERYVSEGADGLASEFGVAIDTVRGKASDLGLHTIAGHARWGKERALNTTSCDIHYFDQWSPNMSYILGFLYADGSISKELTSIAVCISSKDESVLDFIKSEMRSIHPIRRKAGYVAENGMNCRPQSILVICSIELVQGLLKRGIRPRKTYNDDPFPEIPNEMMPHFIRGYLDGDGCISKGCVSFVGSQKFIVGLRDVLVKMAGMTKPPIRVVNGKTAVYANVAWQNYRDMKLFQGFAYPSNATFWFERKKKRLDDWLASHNPQGMFYYNQWTKKMCPTKRALELGFSQGD